MSTLDSTMRTGLEADAPTIFFAVEMLLPSAVTIRLMEGAGFVTFSAKTFVGRDDTYGTIGGIESFTDGLGDEAPTLTFRIYPPTNAAAATLAAAAAQGSSVSLWWGVVNPVTGAVVGTPELIFDGELDVATLQVGPNSRAVEMECVTVFERLFENDEMRGLTDADHQFIWAAATDQRMFRYVTDLPQGDYWGIEGPKQANAGHGSNDGIVGALLGSAVGRHRSSGIFGWLLTLF